MALVSCPECGRPNVSDTAEACPSCGYGVKNHFLRIQQAEEHRLQMLLNEKNKRQHAEELIRQELARQDAEEAARLEKEKKVQEEQKKEQEDIAKIVVPDKYPLSELLVGILCSTIVVFLFWYLVNDFYNYMRLGAVPWAILFTVLIILALFTLFWWWCFSYRRKLYLMGKENYQKAQRYMYDQRKKDEKMRQFIEESQQRQEEEDFAKYQASFYVCPNCGKRSGRRISAVTKAISAELMGIASDTLGKNYRCDECKYMW